MRECRSSLPPQAKDIGACRRGGTGPRSDRAEDPNGYTKMVDDNPRVGILTSEAYDVVELMRVDKCFKYQVPLGDPPKAIKEVGRDQYGVVVDPVTHFGVGMPRTHQPDPAQLRHNGADQIELRGDVVMTWVNMRDERPQLGRATFSEGQSGNITRLVNSTVITCAPV
ncbi:hypothetical protein GOEFS_021_00460 [Gordonia effusa NBRC 100432]|uniref:Uncharacterized protein n=1 Tax=Gordonia effusa NBRC 100432 TaxID=1077974 RepID=H0QWL8_9ACTN|nr:hypothetical protein GOEFS_021_00460 [Gordonia effusa NBRC 100432]